MKVLVLGHTGMLGNAVKKYLTVQNYEVEIISTSLRWNNTDFNKAIINSDSEFIINCIGAIPQKKLPNEYFKLLNIDLPRFLDGIGKKIIHPATDCEFSGNLEYPKKYGKFDVRDAYDVYGKSKADVGILIETEFINTKMLRTSIFGHEINGHVSLLDWFLNTDDSQVINGYSNYYWNGISTLQWAKEAEKIIKNWDDSPVLTQVGSEGMSKLEFLLMVKKIYTKQNQINSFYYEKSVNKILKTDYVLPPLEQQLIELKQFYNK